MKFGYYGDTKDVKTLLKPLLNLLDGRNDKPFPKGRSRFLKADVYSEVCILKGQYKPRVNQGVAENGLVGFL